MYDEGVSVGVSGREMIYCLPCLTACLNDSATVTYRQQAENLCINNMCQ